VEHFGWGLKMIEEIRVVNENNRNFKEERLLGKIIALIKKEHNFSKVLKVRLHTKIENYECDAIVYFETENEKTIRTLEIEFKEQNIQKLVSQLLDRREFFNYQYGVIYFKPYLVVDYLIRYDWLKVFYEKGIGIIAVDNGIHHILKSKFMKAGLGKWTEGGD